MTGAQIAVLVCSVAAAMLLVAAFCLYSNNKLGVSRYKLTDPKISRPFRIVHLSDLHAKRFGKNNCRLVKLVKKCKPDIIAFTGDIIHLYRKPGEAAAIEFVEQLSKIAPFYYVSGNHEMRYKNYREFSKRLTDAGAIILENEYVITHGAAIVGLGCAQLKNNTIFQVTPDFDIYKILLAHEPQYLRRFARAGYDLVLSGHAHGGQWRIPFIGQGLYAPGQGLLPELTAGRHSIGSTNMIISRGLGNSEFPLRINNRPEVVVIDLAPAQQSGHGGN